MCRELSKPIVETGVRVLVDGRPGVVVDYLPGVHPYKLGLVTCTATLIVDHGGEETTYVVNDWTGTPRVEVVDSSVEDDTDEGEG